MNPALGFRLISLRSCGSPKVDTGWAWSVGKSPAATCTLIPLIPGSSLLGMVIESQVACSGHPEIAPQVGRSRVAQNAEAAQPG